MSKSNLPQGRHVRMLCLAAFLAALSFLLGLVAKAIQGTSPLRITLEGLPIVFAGITLGPILGAAAGVVADLLSCLLAGQAPLPLISVGAAAVGAVPGVAFWLLARRERPFGKRVAFPTVLLCDGLAHLVGSVLIKSAALSRFYGFDTLLWRLPIYLVIIAVEAYLLYMLLRSVAVRRELERLVKK